MWRRRGVEERRGVARERTWRETRAAERAEHAARCTLRARSFRYSRPPSLARTRAPLHSLSLSLVRAVCVNRHRRPWPTPPRRQRCTVHDGVMHEPAPPSPPSSSRPRPRLSYDPHQLVIVIVGIRSGGRREAGRACRCCSRALGSRVAPEADMLPVSWSARLGWFGSVWFGSVWFGLVRFGLVRFGLVWFGLVWFGLVWFGLVWSVWTTYDIITMAHYATGHPHDRPGTHHRQSRHDDKWNIVIIGTIVVVWRVWRRASTRSTCPRGASTSASRPTRSLTSAPPT